MNSLPPERPLPQHTRHRAWLNAVIRADDAAPHRRKVWVPVVAAFSVAALVAGGSFVVQNLQTSQSQNTTAGPSKTTANQAKKQGNAPGKEGSQVSDLNVRYLSAAEAQDLRQSCVDQERRMGIPDGSPHSIAKFDRVLFGLSVSPRGAPGELVSEGSWAIVAKGDGKKVEDRAACLGSKNPVTGKTVGLTTARPIPSQQPKGGGDLFQIVNGGASGLGFFVPPITRVTFQAKAEGAVETNAVVKDGMWFYPESSALNLPDDGSDLPHTDKDLLLLPGHAYRYRGYDAAGKLIYDSERDGPFAKDCYTDPEGKKVISQNKAKNPTPETCHRTYHWTAPGR